MTEWGFCRRSLSGNLHGTITNYGQPLMDFHEGYKISNSAWVADYSWEPPMFNSSWTFFDVGEGEMGGFVKDTLYARRNDDQPGSGRYNTSCGADGTFGNSRQFNGFT